MRMYLAVLLIPLMLSTSSMAASSSVKAEEPRPIVKIAAFLARALITFRFTSVLAAPAESQEEVMMGLDPSKFPNLSQVALNEEDALRAIGDTSLIHPKGVFTMRTKGFFTKKFDWEIKTRFLGDVTSAQILCKPLVGRPKVGVTLVNKSILGDKANWRKAHGKFKDPDFENECGWKDYNDVLLAMFLGRTSLLIQTVDNPDGALEGEIINIGIDSD